MLKLAGQADTPNVVVTDSRALRELLEMFELLGISGVPIEDDRPIDDPRAACAETFQQPADVRIDLLDRQHFACNGHISVGAPHDYVRNAGEHENEADGPHQVAAR